MAGSAVTQSVYAQTGPDHKEEKVFNYELVKMRYLDACENYFKEPKSITGPWTLKARYDIINAIKTNDQELLLINLTYNLQTNDLEKYQVVLEDEDEKLVVTGTSVEVLPYEECFDIFVELHFSTAHGGRILILNKLINNFLVNEICLNFFLLNCNVCKEIRLQNMNPVKFNDCISIEILKAPIQDHECRFIMFYIDKATSYMLLRPLMAMDEYELSIEILKIFTEFGPPVVIKTMHAPLLNNVLMILERGGFHYDISIQENDQLISETYYLMQQIVARTNPDSIYWSTMCRFVQYKHNKGELPMRDPILDTVVESVKPFTQLFHSDKKKTVQTEDNVTKDTANILEASSKIETTTEEYVISSETLDSETASETEESQSIKSNAEIEEKLDLSKHQTQEVLTVTTNASEENDENENPTFDNMNAIDNNDIKIEFNPMQIVPPQGSDLEMSSMPQIQVVNISSHKLGTPLIIDSIPLKAEPVLDESLLSSGASTAEVPQIPELETNAAPSSQHYLYVGTPHSESKKMPIYDKKDDDRCSACKGKMLTDFFCFGCKRKTHIFCMNRVTTPLEKLTDTVISFTYCELCLQAKYNLTSAIKFDT